MDLVGALQEVGSNRATPDHSQNVDVGTATSPSTAEDVREVCTAYLASYKNNGEATVDMRKHHGTAFVLALLRHHFPESEGFQVRAAPFGSIIKFPTNFMIRGKEGTKADFEPLVP